MAFELPDLPYAYDALEPHIDAETMRIHHDLHHKAYVDNANAALDGTEWANHSLFWQIMSPDGGGAPSGDLASAIDDTFGGLDALKAAVNDGGVKRFGSGWTWLVWDGTGLALYSTPNQDSPLMQSDEPLLGIDVWEHAYYLKYQNKRPAYLEAWWNVVNWDEVARRYAEARG